MQLMIDILEDPILQLNEKKLEIWFEGTNLIQVCVAIGQSRKTWIVVSLFLSHPEHVVDIPTPHLLLR